MKATPQRKTFADCSPNELEFLTMLDKLSEAEKSQLFRYSVRLLNDCPKARRLTDMANAGKISSRQLLASM